MSTIVELRSQAEKNDVRAQLKLGVRYLRGHDTSIDPHEGGKWLGKASDAGNSTASGYCLYEGLGRAKDTNRAFEFFKVGAEKDKDEDAMNMIGQCYLYGSGTTTNQTDAFKWYQNAADAGCIAAINNLGYCYELGYGAKQSYDDAYKYYQDAAKRGCLLAINNLGMCFEHGWGTTKNLEEAFKDYIAAANKGAAVAACNVGRMYEDGLSVPKDSDLAAVWYERASFLGSRTSKSILLRLLNKNADFKKQFYWKRVRVLMIGWKKNSTADCPIAKLPRDVMKVIVALVTRV